jgi:hypothetical protein
VDLTRQAQDKNKLEYQLTQKNKVVPPPLLRIGEYHPETGRYKVLFPNGGQVIAGNKLFNSSVAEGTPVRATQAYGSQSISLDYKNHIPLEIEEQEQESSILFDTYIIIFIDTSGSMDNEIASIISALNTLKEFLKIEIYKTQERVDQYLQIRFDSSEYWLNWMSVDPRENNSEPNKVIILGFINESEPYYHSIPRNVSTEPKLSFNDDTISFFNAYEQRDFFKGKIYTVEYPSYPELEIAFSAHVKDAIDGTSPYPSPGLQEYNLSYTLGLVANTSPETYLEDIKSLLGL